MIVVMFVFGAVCLAVGMMVGLVAAERPVGYCARRETNECRHVRVLPRMFDQDDL